MMVAAANVMKHTAQMSVCLDSMARRASSPVQGRPTNAGNKSETTRPNGLVTGAKECRGEAEKGREKQRTNRRKEKLGSKPEMMEPEYVRLRKGYTLFLADG
jgi:hypothetical protein